MAYIKPIIFPAVQRFSLACTFFPFRLNPVNELSACCHNAQDFSMGKDFGLCKRILQVNRLSLIFCNMKIFFNFFSYESERRFFPQYKIFTRISLLKKTWHENMPVTFPAFPCPARFRRKHKQEVHVDAEIQNQYLHTPNSVNFPGGFIYLCVLYLNNSIAFKIYFQRANNLLMSIRSICYSWQSKQ